MKVNDIVKQIKTENQDYEYYPTTMKMVEVIYKAMGLNRYEPKRILDIGCGQGDFFEKLRSLLGEDDKYSVRAFGIEKSPILIQNQPDYLTLLGTDFEQQTLLDKKMDCVFCNPPYSHYAEWTLRIIKEANTKEIFLVIPERWRNDEEIEEAIKKRNYTVEVLDSSDFYEAERRARAKVDILKLTRNRLSEDVFDLWFDETFKLSADKNERTSYTAKEETRERIETGLAKAESKAELLIAYYNDDMERLFANYKSLESLDSEIFKELNIDIRKVKESLRERISGLKHVYWNKLFDCYDSITSRLTSFSKDKILNKLRENADIDFTQNNIFAITMWVVKNSNKLFNEQLVDYFKKLASSESIIRYKSNRHYNEDSFRYNSAWDFNNMVREGKISRFYFDYRIVYQKWSENFERSWGGKTYLSVSAVDFVRDTINIFGNMGYQIEDPLEKIDGKYSDEGWGNKKILFKDGTEFCQMKMYKNGNVHLKFKVECMQRLNVEASRLLGWCNTKEEAAEELGMNPADVSRAWRSNSQLKLGDGLSFLGLPETI